MNLNVLGTGEGGKVSKSILVGERCSSTVAVVLRTYEGVLRTYDAPKQHLSTLVAVLRTYDEGVKNHGWKGGC